MCDQISIGTKRTCGAVAITAAVLSASAQAVFAEGAVPDILWLPPPESCVIAFAVENMPAAAYGGAGLVSKATLSSKGSELVVWREYDAEGRVITRESRYTEFYSDVDSRDVTKCGYDARGNLVRKTVEGTTGRGPFYHATYNDAGQLLVETYDLDLNGDGVIDERSFVRYAYDHLGRPVRQDREWDFDLDETIDGHSAYLVTYDAYGHRSRVVLENYRGATGVVHQRSTNYADWADAQRVLRYGFEDDTNADGTPELWNRFTNTYTDGRLTAQTYELDWRNESYDGPADGRPDDWFDASFEYDAAGRQSRWVYFSQSTDEWAPANWQEDVFAYDEAGRLVRQVSRHDNEADGVIDFTNTYTRAFRADRLVERVAEYNTGYESSSFRREVFHWDATGRLHKVIETEFITGEPVESRSTTTYQYAHGGGK